MSDKKKRNGGETALWRRWLLPFLCVTGSVGLYLALTVAGPSEGPVSGDGRVARDGYGGGEQEYQIMVEGLEEQEVSVTVQVSLRWYTKAEAVSYTDLDVYKRQVVDVWYNYRIK